MIGDVLDRAFSWHEAFLLVSAVAFGRFCVGFLVDGLGIMGRDDGCHAVHAGVAHFQGVSIAYLVKFVIFWGVFIYEL